MVASQWFSSPYIEHHAILLKPGPPRNVPITLWNTPKPRWNIPRRRWRTLKPRWNTPKLRWNTPTPRWRLPESRWIKDVMNVKPVKLLEAARIAPALCRRASMDWRGGVEACGGFVAVSCISSIKTAFLEQSSSAAIFGMSVAFVCCEQRNHTHELNSIT